MEALCNIPSVGSIENVKLLRQLYDKVESHVRSLKSLGVDSGSYGNLMISILMNKFTSNVCHSYEGFGKYMDI